MRSPYDLREEGTRVNHLTPDVRKAWREWLSEYPWSRVADLAFNFYLKPRSPEAIIEQVKRGFLAPLESLLRGKPKVRDPRVGAAILALLSKHNNPHAHVLLLSPPHAGWRSLSGLYNQTIANLWPYGKEHGVRVQRIYDELGLCDYLANPRNLRLENHDTYRVEFWREDLTEAARIPGRVLTMH